MINGQRDINPRLTPAQFAELLEERILLFDGAMGTCIQDAELTAVDFGGEQYEGCNEYLSIVKPDLIEGIHSRYLAAGADIVETNTFGAIPFVLEEYGLSERALEINEAAALIARRVASEYDGSCRIRYVAGSMGPSTRSISLTGGITFDEMVEHYSIQVRGLLQGGVDLLLLETSQDMLNTKAGLVAIRNELEQFDLDIPVMVSATIETMGTTLAGQSVEAVFTSLEHAGLSAVGLNCGTGPTFMTDHLRNLSSLSDLPVSMMPNAGLPDHEGRYIETPDEMTATMGRFIEEGWVNIVGGCCGTNENHIKALADCVAGATPRRPAASVPAAVSGVDYLPLDDYTPVIVGERTNVIGSRAFKHMIGEGDMERAAEVGQRQIRDGAHILDVCLADPDRDEPADMAAFLDVLVRKVRVPLMIDTTDHEALEIALKRSLGKAIVNSINLENGEERFDTVVPLIRKYGAAVIVGCIDEDPEEGMARTWERKLSIAQRSYDLLTDRYGLPERDLIFDPLVFPVGTGDRAYLDAAIETIKGVRAIKEALPGCRTILGISNVSFGLPPAGREVLNAVFLHLNLQNGLDMAIVNSEKLLRVTQIEESELKLCEDLIFNRGEDPLGAFISSFSDRESRHPQTPAADLPLEERLARYIVEGYRDGLKDDLDEALQSMDPLEIINGPLMAGMGTVGKLFNENELIVAEVLQSAEVMKAAVSHLEPHIETAETAERGTILLATVKGDVHDIGKNLVDIILSNNGYRVVDLGIKVMPQELVRAAHEEKPDLIGLSGLLVKSARQMVTTAEELRRGGIDVPLLVGGAALTRKFTDSKIGPAYGSATAYARDAMDGLALAGRLLDPDFQKEEQRGSALPEETGEAPPEGSATGSEEIREDVQIEPGGGLDHSFELPQPPDLKPHLLSENDIDLNEVFRHVNPAMLYGRHLGLKGRFEEKLAAGDPKAVELHSTVREIQEKVVSEGLFKPRAVYRFFRAAGEGNDLVLLDPAGRRDEARFTFGRQSESPYRCLSDYVRPRESGQPDTVALFLVTAGHGVMERSRQWKEEGRYLWSHTIQALALETAEALAEWVHERLRRLWGIADPPEMTRSQLFKARYTGLRFSFGYPACPDLEDQEELFRLLDGRSATGIELTDGYMMEPEASVSAIVFHHPQAEYFSVL